MRRRVYMRRLAEANESFTSIRHNFTDDVMNYAFGSANLGIKTHARYEHSPVTVYRYLIASSFTTVYFPIIE